MKFSKYNNPSSRKKHCRKHSKAYVEKQKEELFILLGKEKIQANRNVLLDAYSITMNP